jgi:hypothetical protein
VTRRDENAARPQHATTLGHASPAGTQRPQTVDAVVGEDDRIERSVAVCAEVLRVSVDELDARV